MFLYEKKLQFPVKVATPNPKLASFIISQYGGPDGEVGAAMRYLSQRYAMPYAEAKGLLTDIGTEELGHLEMVGTIVHQLTRTLTQEQIASAGFAPYFVDHTTGVYPTAASGFPWSAGGMQSTGDVIADLTEDLAADGAMAEGQQGRSISLWVYFIPVRRQAKTVLFKRKGRFFKLNVGSNETIGTVHPTPRPRIDDSLPVSNKHLYILANLRMTSCCSGVKFCKQDSNT